MDPFPRHLNVSLIPLKAFCQQVRQPRIQLCLKFALQTRIHLSNDLLGLHGSEKFPRSYACRLISSESVYFASILALKSEDFFCGSYCALSVIFYLMESPSSQKVRLNSTLWYFPTETPIPSLTDMMSRQQQS